MRVDPALRLFVGRPVMINQNLDVENFMANGAMCSFKSLKLKNGYEDFDTINCDGCFVRCITADKVQSMEVVLEDSSDKKVLTLETTTNSMKVSFPSVNMFESRVSHKTDRKTKLSIKLTQFPISVADARTVHRLQGRSLETLLISNWSFPPNWVCVALSRVCNSDKLFVRMPLHLQQMNTNNDIKHRTQVHDFMKSCKNTKLPKYYQ